LPDFENLIITLSSNTISIIQKICKPVSCLLYIGVGLFSLMVNKSFNRDIGANGVENDQPDDDIKEQWEEIHHPRDRIYGQVWQNEFSKKTS
jgi:hypothetical protein